MTRALAIPTSLANLLLSMAVKGGYERAGLALGTKGRVAVLFPADNMLRSPVRFLADPLDIVAGHSLAENLGLEVLALYHTHPFGDPAPSRYDVEGMRLWPLPWIIASPRGVRAWELVEGTAVEVELRTVE